MTSGSRVPGEEGIWVLILGEMFVFSLFFIVLGQQRSAQPLVFEAGRLTLDRSIGLINTLLLLSSSLLVALAVRRARAAREQPSREAALLLRGAMACGVGFVLLKLTEYGAKIASGITPQTNDFYFYYFAFTGIHLAHVLFGLGVLFVIGRTAQLAPSPTRVTIIECGALFWHLVDLLWIMLFALFYVAGGHG